MREGNKLYWWASWYAKVLGYKSLDTFQYSMQKAMDTCIRLGIDLNENMIEAENNKYTRSRKDFKLSKFFCFLISIHADARKPIVKRARAYFLNELVDVPIQLDRDDYFERAAVRESIRESSSDLNKNARRSGVKNMSNFINEGYMGFYNIPMNELKKRKGIPENDDLFNHLGMTELAAHLFRISLTEEKLKRMQNSGEEKAIREHWKIATKIRDLVRENSGTYPEYLKAEVSLEKIEKSLKKAQEILNSDHKDKRLNTPSDTNH